MGFVFYDTETTGTDTVFDQILQFAAIHADDELTSTESFNLRCKLLPHVVPSPGAMRVTGVTAAQLINSELPTHYTMVRAIRDKLQSWSPALFIGFNSLEFDEPLLRQALYQTLHPPYLTNSDGNCRADALDLARMAALFVPNSLVVPLDAQGKPTFKLEKLAPANGFDHANAHDALGDVKATIFLCKLISERAPEVWSNFVRFSQKSAVVDHANDELVFCLSDFFFGKPYSWLVTSLGNSPSLPTDILVFDLATNPDDLRAEPDEQLLKRFSRSPKIVRRMRSNACPAIMPAEYAPDICEAKTLATAEIERRAEILRDDQQLRERFVRIFEQARKEYDPWPHVEQQIHDAIISDADKLRLESFHNAPWEQRFGLLDAIQDGRLKQLGRRLIFVERPDVLPPDLQLEMQAVVANRLINGDGAGTWLCLAEAIQNADDMIAVATAKEQVELLKGHRDFLAARLAEATAYLA